LIRLRHLFAGTLLCLLPIHVRAQQAPDVAQRLLSNDPKVRADAEGGLVNGAARSLPSLRRLLERGDDNLTTRTFEVIRRIGPPAIPLLVDLLRHERVDVRRTAIDCLIDLAPETEAIQPSLRRALRDEDSRQFSSHLRVARIARRDLRQRNDRVGVTFLFDQHRSEVVEFLECARQVVELQTRACRGQARFDILAIETADTNHELERALSVAASAAPLRCCREKRACVSEQPLLRGKFGCTHERVVGVRFQLENLLVDGRCLRQEALPGERLRNTRELLDRAVQVIGPHVQVTEHVGRVPVSRLVLDQAHVLGDSLVYLSLP